MTFLGAVPPATPAAVSGQHPLFFEERALIAVEYEAEAGAISAKEATSGKSNLVMKGRALESRINDSDALFVVTSMYNDETCFQH